MKALILDVGNTRINCAAWEGESQVPGLSSLEGQVLSPAVPLFDLGALDHPDPGKVADFQAAFLRMHAECGKPPVVLVSVVPDFTQSLPSGLDLRVVDHTSELPFALDIADPAQVGPDRLCNVAAAVAGGLDSALVVDAGTATTFDVLQDGVFIGGMISPGMASAAAGLAAGTARLDPVPFEPAGWAAGNDTVSAMRAGSWHTGIGGILHTVGGLVERYGPLPVILTGGLGVHFVDADWYYDPHWTLRGAAILSKV